MLNKPNEEYIKEGAQNVTEKDVEKVINKSEELIKTETGLRQSLVF